MGIESYHDARLISTRSDDTKSMKGPILDWIVPHRQSLHPPISQNIKIDRGYNHERTGSLLCLMGMDWTDMEYVGHSISILMPN